MTLEGLTFSLKILMLSGLVGFSGTLGMWCFCKVTKWSPVNITVNVSKSADVND